MAATETFLVDLRSWMEEKKTAQTNVVRPYPAGPRTKTKDSVGGLDLQGSASLQIQIKVELSNFTPFHTLLHLL